MRNLKSVFGITLWMVAITVLAGPPLRAQTYTVIHNFANRWDGAKPYAGLTVDAAGNLYGTAPGDNLCCGTVFKLTRAIGGWVVVPLYRFRGGNDGDSPEARVVFGPDGALYGTTKSGGGPGSFGTVFRLSPPLHVSGSSFPQWTETILYGFTGSADGANPWLGDLVFDAAGNLYGTAPNGGTTSNGAIFELIPTQQGWTETTLYDFTGQADGAYPTGTLLLDASGNLYGTALWGGSYGNGGCFGFPCGTVYELQHSGAGWTLSVVHTFQGGNDGGHPVGGIVWGPDGLYGTTGFGGASGGGTVFAVYNSWLDSPYPLVGDSREYFTGPYASLAMDAAGNFYGTTYGDGAYNMGSVFEITAACSCAGCSWYYHLLHDFAGGADGAYPYGGVTVAPNGNLYGTAWAGGSHNEGVVWEIVPPPGAQSLQPKADCAQQH